MSKENDRAALGLDLSTCGAIAREYAKRVTSYRTALAMEWLAEFVEDATKSRVAAAHGGSMKDIIDRSEDAKDDDEMQVVLVRIADGERRLCVPSFKVCYTWADEFWWTDGNMGCECNRHLQWFRVNDLDIDGEEFDCNYDKPKRYYVILRAPDFKNPSRTEAA